MLWLATSLITTLFYILSTLPFSSAVPTTPPRPFLAAGQSVSLFRKPTSSRSADDWGRWAKSQRDYLSVKYSDGGGVSVSPPPSRQMQNRRRKRSTGTNLITNQNADTSFFGSIAVGTPPVSFNVILDTGSADLWLGTSSCQGCTNVKTFDPTSSSSFKNSSTPFNIQYGSGNAGGLLGQDAVQMAGFSVPNQGFGVCDQVSNGLLENPVSGLMGLAFQTIAQSGATPFWQTLAEGNAWDSPVMAFHLTRFLDDTNAQTQEPGGSFNLGFVNNSLFTGDIEFINIPPGQATYWVLPLSSISASGSRFNLPSDATAYAAIDTGTTLIGGPPQAVQAIFAQVTGSEAGEGDLQGYYTYPCANSLNVSLSFEGGRDWTVNDQDMKLNELSNGRCVAALFALETGSNAPSWIIGDTFLKNVYSVFRHTPPSVGFAQLSEAALAMNGVDGLPPTPTVGTAAATVSANDEGSMRRVTNGAGTGGVGSALCASVGALMMVVVVELI